MQLDNLMATRDYRPFAEKALANLFGFPSFRDGQAEVVNAILNGQDTLAVMPTGAGKSVCYQLPATRPGTFTLVVTPLRALMRDQVQHLAAHGIPAAAVDSGVDAEERRAIYETARAGGLRLLYVAPERLVSREFQDFAHSLAIDLLVVDEAHCVLQWGNDFRPEYAAIGGFAASLTPRPVVAAFTATATPDQRDEIAANLGLKNRFIIVTDFDRPNIHFRVVNATPAARLAQIAAWAAARPDECGIVYCATRKRTEQMADALAARGLAATHFHAGMDDARKAEVQDGFLAGRITVICATTAFGMGVDKPDVRWVINDSVPGSLEEYYQEAGRAGRDGKPAVAVLMWSKGDFLLLRKRADEEAGSALADPADRERARIAAKRRVNAISRYCEAERCLRAMLLDYFGQNAPESCGDCSVCDGEDPEALAEAAPAKRRRPGRGRAAAGTAAATDADEPVMVSDATRARVAPLALDGLDGITAASGRGVGIGTLALFLHGSKAKTITGKGLDKLAQWGSCADLPTEQIEAVIGEMVGDGRLGQTAGLYKTLFVPGHEVKAADHPFVRGLDPAERRAIEQAIVRLVGDMTERYGAPPAVSGVAGVLAGDDRDFMVEAGYTRHPDFGRFRPRYPVRDLRALIDAMVEAGTLVRGERNRLSLP
ncbi:ATP-dependent DNA helicase RecQ [Bifidobacterium pullorum subsp. saeculare]|uniref:ATP-dependent DNA helicase RecQ n=1 Tax=Bifidobacterium pullorum subsp. saeculare TaxID=78257 RepID=A0A938X139_9BIFI|nr:ATP-dependent DNA helicase RecQ [Bifidobacterium pullorum]MBM6700362.1 ATP-dependent DNA helicase RecQ [Bifidobacterium pullorum subsp. saeculare]